MRRVSFLALVMGLGVVAPFVAIALLSLSPSSGMDFFADWTASARWWEALVNDRSWHLSFLTSFIAGLVSATIALAFILPSATYWRLSGNRAVLACLGVAALPLAIPPIVLAVGLYQLVARLGLFDTFPGLVLAYLSVAAPVVILVVLAGFATATTSHYEIARSLGASATRAALTWMNACQRQTVLGAVAVAVLLVISEGTVSLYVTDAQVVPVSRKALSGISRDISPIGFAAMTSWGALILFMLVAVKLFARTRGRNHGN